MDSGLRKLKSQDGKIFEVEEKYLSMSKFFKDLLNDFPDPNQEIEINQVDGKTLEKIIEYLKHYETEKPKEIPKPLPNNDLKPVLNDWDYNFITPLSIEECIDLVNGANYLDIADLFNLASARLAVDIMTGTIEEVRKKFGIVSDMTEEEMKEFDKYPID